MIPTTCPRCGCPLPEGAYLEALKQAAGRQPVFRLRHPKPNGRMCVAYVGAESDTMPKAEGEAPPPVS